MLNVSFKFKRSKVCIEILEGWFGGSGFVGAVTLGLHDIFTHRQIKQISLHDVFCTELIGEMTNASLH